MELRRRSLVAALVVAAVVAVPAAAAATPRSLSAKVGSGVTFTTTFQTTKAGGKLAWKLNAAKFGKSTVAVRLIVPYEGKPLALTLCTKCRSTEVGQAIVAITLARAIAAGKARVEVAPPRGKTLSALLKP